MHITTCSIRDIHQQDGYESLLEKEDSQLLVTRFNVD